MHYLYPGNPENKFLRAEYLLKEKETDKLILKQGYIKVSDEDFEALRNHQKCWDDSGNLIPYAPTQGEIDAKQVRHNRRAAERQIKELEQWFEQYDGQIKQYERAMRLNIAYDLHVNGVTYDSINALDNEAQQKAAQIRNLRSQLI